MEKAIRKKRIAIAVSLLSFVFALGLTALSFMCIKEPYYLVMAIAAVLAVVFYYVAVHSFFKFIDMRATVELIDIINSAQRRRVQINISEISAEMGWRNETTVKFINKCRKKGYIR